MLKENIKILLIEDNPGDYRLIKEMLNEMASVSFIIYNKENLSDAITYIKEQTFDVALLDLNLPDSNGIESFLNIKDHLKGKPVIVLSGMGDKDLALEAVKNGAQDYLIKGKVNSEILERSIQYAVERSYLLRELTNELKERKRIEKALINSETKHRNLIENSPIGIYQTNFNGNFILANKSFCEIIEFDSVSEIQNIKAASLYKNPEDRDYLLENIRKFGSVKDYELEVLTKTGKVRNVLLNIYSEENYMSGVMVDITESKEHLREIEKSEERYRSIFRTAANLIASIDKKGIIVDYNNKAKKVLGYEDKELIGKSIKTVIDPRYIHFAESILRKILTEGNAYDQEFKMIKKDGSLIDVLVNASGLKEGNGSFHSIICIIEDITDRNRVRARLEHERDLLHTLMNNIPDTIYFKDSESRFIRINKTQSELLGLNNPKEALGKTEADFFDDEITRKVLKDEKNIITNGSPSISKAEEIHDSEGIKKWVSATKVPIKDRKGNITGLVGISRDITNLKKAEEHERKTKCIFEWLHTLNQKKYASEDKIIEYALEKVVNITDSEGGYVHFLNPDKSMKLYKWSESVQKICTAKKENHYPLSKAGIWADCVRTGKPAIHNNYSKIKDAKGLPEGHFPVKRHMSVPVFDNDKIVAVCGVGNKKTEYDEENILHVNLFMNEMWKILLKLRAEKLLKESEERFRGLYENATIGIYRTTSKGIIIMANPALVHMLGYDSFEELQKDRTIKERFTNQENRILFQNIIEEEGVIYDWEDQWMKADRTIIDVKESARGIKDNEGNYIYYEGVVEDVTEQMKAEKALIEAKELAEKSDRLKSEFLNQMSHEIRTPMNTILSFTDLLKTELAEYQKNDIVDYFKLIDSAGKRIVRTIDLILNMSEILTKTYKYQPYSFDLYKDVLLNLHNEFHKEAKMKNLGFEIINKAENSKLKADEYSIVQIFNHLIDNAIKFTKEGKVNVTLSNNSMEELTVIVQDTGLGISKDFLNSIYEPFVQEDHGYSRKFEGNGLGLALVKKYCELNNVKIEVESTKGEGTTFKVILKTEVPQFKTVDFKTC
ncbi:PAS domain S-box protein [Bacteroidota bacterium]